MPHFEIAIIDSNTLSALGLQPLLSDMIPIAEVRTFISFDDLEAADHGQFVHYFVASRIYFEHTAYFRKPSRRSIVLVNGDLHISDVPTLNVCQPEQALVKSILSIHKTGHPHGLPGMSGMPSKATTLPHGMSSDGMNSHERPSNGTLPHEMPPHKIPPKMAEMMEMMRQGHTMPSQAESAEKSEKEASILSPREIEVAILLSKGLINKEIADRLNISVTTAITHRKNIMEKLHAHSLANIIIYVVMNGLVEIGEL